MARPQDVCTLPERDRKVLERLCRYGATHWQIALRAMIVLKCGLGERVDEIAGELHVSHRTVYKWRNRYRQLGLAGIDDRSGHGTKLPPELIDELLSH